MLSTNAICYEGICRVYRNAVVKHIRKTLSVKYPRDWEAMIRRPFAKEWDKIRKSAESPRVIGVLGDEIKDEAEYLGVSHFYNLFELYFDELIPNDSGMDDTDRRQLKQQMLTWSRNIKQLRDPVIGHPADEDVTFEDAFTMLDSARRVLGFIDSDAAKEIAALRDSIVSSDHEPPMGLGDSQRHLEASTLPPREVIARDFVGRRAELQELEKWLHDPHARAWLLAGDGGKGKTSIAYQFAIETLKEPPKVLETVIWLSAKSSRFVSGWPVEIENPDFVDLTSALDWVLRAYGAPDIEKLSLEEKENVCREYLTQLPALVILDDVDSLEVDNLRTVMSYFLFRVPTSKSKILLTSRRVIMAMEHTQVKGFDRGSTEGLTFIASRLQLFKQETKQFSTAVKNDILGACDGSPLFIEDLLRLCAVGEMPRSAILRWKKDGGETVRKYALERELEMLSPAARNVLLACAIYDGPVGISEIRVATELSEMATDMALQELQELFLVPKPQLVEDTPRFALNGNTRQLVIDVLGKSDLAARITNVIRAIAGRGRIGSEHRRRVSQFIRQAVTQVKLNQYREGEETLLEALRLYPDNADLHGMLGWVYRSWSPNRRLTDARVEFGRAADLKALREDTYRHWWQLEMDQSEWTAAAVAAERGLEVLQSSEQLSYMAGFARSRCARELLQQAQYGRAGQEATQAEGYLERALVDPDQVRTGQYGLHSRMHRARVLNYEIQMRICRIQHDSDGEARYSILLSRGLDRWAREHPEDSLARSEGERIRSWFALVRE